MDKQEMLNIVSGCLAKHPVPHISIQCVAADEINGIWTILLKTAAHIPSSFDYEAYHEMIASCIQSKTGLAIVLVQGLQPDYIKNKANRE